MTTQSPDSLITSLLLIEILRMIPRQRKITTRQIQQQLAEIGYERDLRSIQRQIETLCRHFPIERDERTRPFGYRWFKHAQGLNLPQLTVPESLLLSLAQGQLKLLLPSNLREPLHGLWQHANVFLEHQPKSGAARQWLKKVRVIPTSLALLPPSIDNKVLDSVSEALYHNHYLYLDYYNSQGETKADVKVMPLGLAQQGVRLYLVVRFEKYDNQRILALHRIRRAVSKGETFVYPESFDLATYDLEGHFGFGDGTRVRVSFCISLDAGFHLTETPLSEQQFIEKREDHYFVEAVLVESQLLTAWLNSWGERLWDVKREMVK